MSMFWMVQIPGEWLVDQVRKGTCQELVQTVPLHSVGSPQDVLWGTIGITARLEWLARLAGTSPESTDADPGH